MSAMTKVNSGAPVEATDELTIALGHAQERVRKVYAAGRKTLLDEISDEEWAAWDESDELALVADKNGLDEPCPLDDDFPEKAAA